MENNELKPIGACGLYCGACRKYKAGNCPGCRANEKAQWCKVRQCCIKYKHTTCADCMDYGNLRKCHKFNSFMGMVMGIVFNSNRYACIDRIRDIGHEEFIIEMEQKGLQTLKRRRPKQ